MTYVLLGLSAVIVGLTVYVGLRMNEPPAQTSSTKTRKGLSEEEKVLARSGDLMEAGAARKAAELLASYVRAHPRSIPAGLLLAQALMRSGQVAMAEKAVDQILQIGLPTAEALWLKGELVRLRAYQGYSQSLAAAMWVPGVPVPGRGASKHMHYFRQAAEKGADADGKIWLRFAMELLEATDEELMGEGDLLARREELAETYLNKALADDERDVRALASLGTLAMKKDNYKRAATMLSEAARKNPNDDRLWALLAEAQKEAGDLAEAARSVQRALDIRQSREALLLKAQIAQLRSQYDQAAEAYVEAAADPRLRPKACFEAARCYYHQEKYALAMRYIDIASSLIPGNPKVAKLQQDIELERFGPPESEDPKLKFNLRPVPGEPDPDKPSAPKPSGGALPGLGKIRP